MWLKKEISQEPGSRLDTRCLPTLISNMEKERSLLVKLALTVVKDIQKCLHVLPKAHSQNQMLGMQKTKQL